MSCKMETASPSHFATVMHSETETAWASSRAKASLPDFGYLTLKASTIATAYKMALWIANLFVMTSSIHYEIA